MIVAVSSVTVLITDGKSNRHALLLQRWVVDKELEEKIGVGEEFGGARRSASALLGMISPEFLALARVGGEEQLRGRVRVLPPWLPGH